MAEYVTKEQVINWYRPYGQADEPIPFETLVSDLRDMKAADVAPVRHGRWVKIYENGEPATQQHQVGVFCSRCKKMPKDRFTESDFCPNCGVKMDGGAD